jgi:replication-associated recombination protein RarA
MKSSTSALAGKVYYEPADQRLEIKVGERLERLRRQRLERKRTPKSSE